MRRGRLAGRSAGTRAPLLEGDEAARIATLEWGPAHTEQQSESVVSNNNNNNNSEWGSWFAEAQPLPAPVLPPPPIDSSHPALIPRLTGQLGLDDMPTPVIHCVLKYLMGTPLNLINNNNNNNNRNTPNTANNNNNNNNNNTSNKSDSDSSALLGANDVNNNNSSDKDNRESDLDDPSGTGLSAGVLMARGRLSRDVINLMLSCRRICDQALDRGGLPSHKPLFCLVHFSRLADAKKLERIMTVIGAPVHTQAMLNLALLETVSNGYGKDVEGCTSLLLSKGANPNAIDSHRCTAVQYAAKRGRLELVRVLHAKGGDLMMKSFDAGFNAFEHAKNSGFVDVALHMRYEFELVRVNDCPCNICVTALIGKLRGMDQVQVGRLLSSAVAALRKQDVPLAVSAFAGALVIEHNVAVAERKELRAKAAAAQQAEVEAEKVLSSKEAEIAAEETANVPATSEADATTAPATDATTAPSTASATDATTAPATTEASVTTAPATDATTAPATIEAGAATAPSTADPPVAAPSAAATQTVVKKRLVRAQKRSPLKQGQSPGQDDAAEFPVDRLRVPGELVRMFESGDVFARRVVVGVLQQVCGAGPAALSLVARIVQVLREGGQAFADSFDDDTWRDLWKCLGEFLTRAKQSVAHASTKGCPCQRKAEPFIELVRPLTGKRQAVAWVEVWFSVALHHPQDRTLLQMLPDRISSDDTIEQAMCVVQAVLQWTQRLESGSRMIARLLGPTFLSWFRSAFVLPIRQRAFDPARSAPAPAPAPAAVALAKEKRKRKEAAPEGKSEEEMKDVGSEDATSPASPKSELSVPKDALERCEAGLRGHSVEAVDLRKTRAVTRPLLIPLTVALLQTTDIAWAVTEDALLRLPVLINDAEDAEVAVEWFRTIIAFLSAHSNVRIVDPKFAPVVEELIVQRLLHIDELQAEFFPNVDGKK